ncbi:hypothetical protein PtA15_10A156 [Puccinia triticina]|uniref:Uncharacterized protein n=1 Tax=Puccinia triticina TaxID=208348 RepID=A0ABY7D1A0_9BASI|nr:uncharacterized protein PtA15_10A156 [Puccinia triticina]WAQ88737.1 hypothetical protein PtA15_10A156 [Puccinia triticina]
MDELDALAIHRFRNQVEYAAKFFGRLAEYDYNRVLTDTQADLSIERLRSKKYLLTELHSTLLPSLQYHITSLSQVLGDSNAVRLNPGYIMPLVIVIQPSLEMTLDRIICVINDIIPGTQYEPTLTNDQHFKELKRHRIRGLDLSIRNELKTNLGSFLLDCRRVIETLMLPADDHTHVRAPYDGQLLWSIESVVKWSKAPELHPIYDQWKVALQNIDFALNDAFFMVVPDQGLFAESVIELLQSFIPVLKLSRNVFSSTRFIRRISCQNG